MTVNPQLDFTTAASTRPSHVRISNLVKRFGTFTALKSVSLSISKAELVCFLGPSGCGKTTLLRAIAGLDPQDSGTIDLAGRDVSSLPPSARDFGIVFQSYALFPNLTVASNIGYGLVNKRMKRTDVSARVSELLTLVGLPDQGAKYPVQLSGGQQQRVALARALATSPSLLLLDEPLSALDARVRVRLRDEIKSLQTKLGVTTILVTHDQEEALAMADRIVVMNHGVIEQVGTPAEIYASPATEFVADFIGTMNFLDLDVGPSGEAILAGITVSVPNAQPNSAGKIRVGFRPEEVQVRSVTAATPNRMSVRVKNIVYLGSFYRATLSPEARPHTTFLADISAADLREQAINPDAKLDVALPPTALRTFNNSGKQM